MIRTVENIMAHYRCDAESAQRYIDLRDEGHQQYQALILAGLADPEEDATPPPLPHSPQRNDNKSEAAEREALQCVTAHLAAAISLLERGGKMAAGSDKMFSMMLDDYRKSLEKARAALSSPAPVGPTEPEGVNLEEIEQYRMQMAGITTAALGYWKEGDAIHPDYDTVALRDVAKLYAKYDALYKAASLASAPPQAEPTELLYAALHSTDYRVKDAAETYRAALATAHPVAPTGEKP